MLGIGTALAGIGIDFVKDLIMDNGEDLVKEGIKKVTGIDLNKKEPRELTPEEVTAIQNAKVQLEEIDYKKLLLEYDNTNDARDMQKEALKQEDVFSKRFVYYLAAFWSLLAGTFIIMVFFVDIPVANARYVDTIIGFLLGTIVATIINFFFGSSKGSKEKTDQLSTMIKTSYK